MVEGFQSTLRDDLGVAAVMARKGVAASAIGAALGLEMPSGPRATFADQRTVVGTGPGTWLIIADDAEPDFAEDLADRLAGLASVSDQSSGYTIRRFSGPGARTLLQRGAAIDFDPAVFSKGSAATTVISHIGVILWQADDMPAYDCAVFRSFDSSFQHWIDQSIHAL